MDALLLQTIAKTLNFKIYNIPTTSWAEVARSVNERLSFMAPVVHMVYPQRMDRYDYSYTYEFASLVFAASKPILPPKWKNIYYPLSASVWILTLIATLLVPFCLYMLNHIGVSRQGDAKLKMDFLVEMTLATLLSQPISKPISSGDTLRILVMAWLLFVFVIGTVYKGNLTAALTMPKYPPRAETVETLIQVVDKVGSPYYANELQNFLKDSDSHIFKSLHEKLVVGGNVTEGLSRAIKNRPVYTRNGAGIYWMKSAIRREGITVKIKTRMEIWKESKNERLKTASSLP
ncbi:hypothetical protein SK128_000022 [Halocaridina rubra]|uniref:Ionotropic glutamate receptor C-terminal domain-containing protein n=1 Tax=Halocaridina rubra TaxID=373956 RepID=A0AAN9AF75_HALRR